MLNMENKKKYVYSNPKLKKHAQKLRREMTRQERKMWYDCLSLLPWKFRRQFVVVKYILDFYCAEKRIAVEIDGNGHGTIKSETADEKRTAFLNEYGITVIRYSNCDIDTRFQVVRDDIYQRLSEIPSVKKGEAIIGKSVVTYAGQE